MKVSESTPVRLTAAGVALICALAGCGKGDDDASSNTSTSATSAPSQATTTEAAAPPAAPADYSSLLITAEDIDSSQPFTAEPPILNHNGENGVIGRFHTEDGAMISSTILVLADPAEAARELELAKPKTRLTLWGTLEPSPIGTNGSVVEGTSPDDITGITMLLFSEQNAVVTLEFDGPHYELDGLPPELIDTVARRQLEILKARLPDIAPPAPLPVAVTVGGKPVEVRGPVVCETSDGKYSITAGNAVLGIDVGLEPDASAVHDADLGNVDGVVMRSTGGATATKDGNTYRITGTASGVDEANPPEPITKPFEIRVTCP